MTSLFNAKCATGRSTTGHLTASSCSSCTRSSRLSHLPNLPDRKVSTLSSNCKRCIVTAAVSQESDTKTVETVDLENVNREYCDDFVCTSSPVIETTVRAFSRDIQRLRYTASLFCNDVEFSDGVRSFKGADRYKRSSWVSANVKDATVRITKMSMLDKGAAEIKWNLKGSLYNLPLDVDVTTVIELQLLTARISAHRERWDMSRCSPPASTAVLASKLLWSLSQLAADGSEGISKAVDSLSSMDEDNSTVYMNQQDPTRFFQQQDTRWPDFIALATVASFLYFIFKAFEAIETMK